MASSDHHLLGHLFRSARPTDLLARPRAARAIAVAGSLALGAVVATGYQATTADAGTTAHRFATTARTPSRTSDVLVSKGRQTFRFDTFGDQGFWGGVLHLDKAIEGAGHGGVGPGVSPKTALAVGLKVDVTKLPRQVRDAIAAGKVDLDDPGVTLALLKLNSVVGVKGFFNSDGTLRTVGIECALCHSTVDDSFAPGIGHRRDGWANRDLNVGAIVSLAPNLQPVANLLHTDVPTVKKVLGAWGPGKFDAELFLDGKGFQPDGRSAATLIPPAFGLQGVNLHTWTGWGSIPYWNAFVANLEMHGQGTFFDSRLDNAKQFPIAAENGFGHVRSKVDLISPKLPALQAYQLALAAPKPPSDSFDHAAAARGKALFMGQAQCSTCHVPPTFTEPGNNLHPGRDIGIDSFEADRSPTHMYRTSPLRGLWTHQKGGFYHDGRFPTLLAVVDHYDKTFGLHLTDVQKHDLVEYLKSL
jgi:cytochrome c peroxidase